MLFRSGFPVSILQKSHRRVHLSPPIKKVASRSSQHSKIFGHAASWQTVWRLSRETSERSAVYSGPILARVFIHSGFRSIGTSALRASILKSGLPLGALDVMRFALVLRIHISPLSEKLQKLLLSYPAHLKSKLPPSL